MCSALSVTIGSRSSGAVASVAVPSASAEKAAASHAACRQPGPMRPDGALTGFVSVGMPRTAAELTLLFERRGELPADRSLLLRFDGPDYDPSADADAFAPATTVCWCNGVTVGRIEESAACGNTTVECVGRDTRAGTGCGGCKGRIADVLARAAEADETPSLTP